MHGEVVKLHALLIVRYNGITIQYFGSDGMDGMRGVCFVFPTPQNQECKIQWLAQFQGVKLKEGY
jgi:hypothetical protein